MATTQTAPALAIRSNLAVELWTTADAAKCAYAADSSTCASEATKSCKAITFSADGRYFAYTNGVEIKVLKTADWTLHLTLPRPKATFLKFSPQGNYLCTWELFIINKDNPNGSPNMFIYELTKGASVLSCIQTKQTDWEPCWSTDETIVAIIAGGEFVFHDLTAGVQGFETVARRIGGSKTGNLSMAPGNSPPFLAVCSHGSKGAPSMCKLYKYPALAQNQAVACKSFFQADRVEMLWNRRGTALLILTSTEVDKTGNSYYGKQALHFMSAKGDTCSVPLSKEGPVHAVKWSPKANEFLVVYGLMPSKAGLYNLKCDLIFDFGEGPRNCAYFNAFGNIVVLAGFGNLPGSVEVWDVQKKELLSSLKCPDTTYFDWSPNGAYFLTATTAPRLRIGNGFKIYHYSGALMHETLWPEGQELLGVEWQQFAEGTFQEPIITKTKQEGIKSSQPEASKKAYTPPHLRLLKEGKNPELYVPQLQATSAKKDKKTNVNKNTPRARSVRNEQTAEQQTANAAAMQKKTKNKSAAKTSVEGINNVEATNMPVEQQQQQQLNNNKKAKKKQNRSQTQINNGKPEPATEANNEQLQAAGNAAQDATQQQEQQQPKQHANNGSNNNNNLEKDKKIRNVAKKLADIKKLKERIDKGEVLEQNQINKIAMENKFLDELKALKLTSSS